MAETETSVTGQFVKDCFSCKHKADEDGAGIFCDHPTRQVGSLLFSAFIDNGYDPNCSDINTNRQVGWEKK